MRRTSLFCENSHPTRYQMPRKHKLFRNPGKRNVKLIETITKDSPLHQSLCTVHTLELLNASHLSRSFYSKPFCLTTHPHDRFQLQQTRQISNCIIHSNLTPYSFILLGPVTTSHYQRLYLHLRQEENRKDNNWMINPFIPIIIFSFPLPFPILPYIWNHSRSSGICKTHPKL